MKFLEKIAKILGVNANSLLGPDGTASLSDEQMAALQSRIQPDVYQQVVASLGASDTAPQNPPAEDGTRAAESGEGQGADVPSSDSDGQAGAQAQSAPVACATTAAAALEASLEDAAHHATVERGIADLNHILANMAATNPVVRCANPGTNTAIFDAKGLFPDMRRGDAKGYAAQDINDFSPVRPWNAHARDTIQAVESGTPYTAKTAFDFGTQALKQFEADLSQEIMLHPAASEPFNLDLDVRALPAFWPKVYNVQSGTTYGLSKSGHAIQPYGQGFKPNNRLKIQPELVTLHKVEVNYEFDVDEMAQLENSWLAIFNQPKGSANAYKIPFVRYVLMYLRIMQDNDLREALICGVWAPNSTRKPGYYLNSLTGLFYKVEQARGTKYLPFTDLGTPTEANIYDYIKLLCERIEKAVGKTANMKIYLRDAFLRAYREIQADRLQKKIDDISTRVDGFKNFELIALDYQEGDFIFVTDAQNIIITNGDAKDENNLRTVYNIKSIQVAGQFYKGIHVGVFGMEPDNGLPVNMRTQRFFSNAEPIHYASVPAPVDATALSAKYGNIIRIANNTEEKTITAIRDYKMGQLVTLVGPIPEEIESPEEAVHGAKIVTGSTFIDPAGKANYVLDSGTTLRLMPMGNDKFAIVGYDGGQVADKVVHLNPDDTAIPVPKDGQEFVTAANTKDTVIASAGEPEHPYNGFTIYVKGGDSLHASKMSTTDKIVLTGEMTFTKESVLTLRYYGGRWYEISRK